MPLSDTSYSLLLAGFTPLKVSSDKINIILLHPTNHSMDQGHIRLKIQVIHNLSTVVCKAGTCATAGIC